MRDVALGDDDALGAGQRGVGAADLEEALDLLVDAADREDAAALVDAAGDADVLARGQARQAREDGEQLGGGGRVALDRGVGLPNTTEAPKLSGKSRAKRSCR